ncbi:hypothetical protein PENSPDRAFT_668677 [Peniophora sp. CONT]|nr:hypothetical protein PENSPDRAFT_668677 [Peniophora sp. CONT]
MTGWSPAVPRTIRLLERLRDACLRSPSHLLVPSDVDVAILPLRFIDEHKNGPMPALEVFASRSEFFVRMIRVMLAVQHLTIDNYSQWGAYFSTLSMILQLVFVRNEAAFIKYGRLEHEDDGLRAYQEYVLSYDKVVAGICRAQHAEHWAYVRDWGVQFVSQQLFSHIVAQSSSTLEYAPFMLGMQRQAGAMYLAVMYQELDALRLLAAAPQVRAVTALSIAEDITRPFDGVRTQAAFAAHLRTKWSGQITAKLVATLTAAEMHALRSPLLVWPDAKLFCHHCSTLFNDSQRGRACKGCHRAMYCGKSCQTSDWKPVHKVACQMWRLVGEREKFKKRLNELYASVRPGYGYEFNIIALSTASPTRPECLGKLMSSLARRVQARFRRLNVEDRWDVMHQLVFELAARFPPAVSWTPDFITAAEFERIELRLATLIAQRLGHMNEADPDAVDSIEEDPPWSREVLVRRNLPPGRTYQNDVREMEEAHAALFSNRPAGSGQFVGRASLTGNIWVLSRSGFVLSMHLSPAVRWAHWLGHRYHAPAGHICCRAPDPNKTLQRDLQGDWVSVCR